MAPKKSAKSEGFDDVIYLDPVENRFIEEAGAANFFALMNNDSLVTPPLGTILPGITRDSVIQLAGKEYNIGVEQRDISVEEVVNHAKECFVTGTAAIITSVSEIGWQDKRYHMNRNNYKLANQLYEKLISIQLEKEDDSYNWVYSIDKM
jgi:branched-chain amino acid aminotransferase